MPPKNYQPLVLRVQALTLLAYNVPVKQISQLLGVPVRTLYCIQKRAKERGFEPQQSFRIDLKHVQDGERSGRPRKSNAAPETEPIESVEEPGEAEEFPEHPTSETELPDLAPLANA